MRNKSLIAIICLLSITLLLPACDRDSEKEDTVTTTEQTLDTEAKSSEQDEIIAFTQQALEIEAKRNELNIFITEGALISEVSSNTAKWFRNLYFLDGYSKDNTFYKQGDAELEGMTSLRKRIMFLDCPQSMQVIKDILNDIYSSEVELGELQLQGEGYYVGVFATGIPFFGAMLVLTEVNQHNIELWLEEYKAWQFPASSSTLLMDHPWVKLQLLRRDVYTRWTEILQERNIDPAEEGFTELIDL